MNKMNRPWLALAAGVVLVLAGACVAAAPPGADIASAPAPAATQPAAQDAAGDAAQQALAPGGPTLGSQRAGDLQMWLSSKPAQPLRGMAEMDAYLVESAGQPVTDAKVTFDTDMTNMSHGTYLVTAAPAGGGHYVGQVRFMMPGPWRVIAIVERPGHETAKLRFEFTVRAR